MDWKKNRLTLALGAFVLLLGITVWVFQANKPESATNVVEKPKLEKIDKSKIDELEVTRTALKETVKLKKQGTAWQMVVPISAEVDESAITSSLDALADLTYRGVAATKASNHNLLEVDESHGVHVVVRGAGKVLLDAWVGAYRGGNTMLRLAGQEEVLSVAGSIKFAFNREVRDWRDRKIVDFAEDKVKSVRVDSAEGHFAFEKSNNKWVQATGEKPIAKFDDVQAGAWVRGLISMRASDFAAPAMDENAASLVQPQAVLTIVADEQGKDREIKLKLGKAQDATGANFFLKREDKPLIYLVSKYLAESMRPKIDKFQKKDEKPAGGAEAAADKPGKAAKAKPGATKIPATN